MSITWARHAELAEAGAEGDAAPAAADDEHVGLGGAARALRLLLPALEPGLALLVRPVLGATRAVLVLRLLVALQLVERREERERLALTVLLDESQQSATATDRGLEQEPRRDDTVRLVRGLVEREGRRVGPRQRALQQVADTAAPLHRGDVPAERHEVAPERLGGEHRGGGRDVARGEGGF
ncbi:hypothetical protein [Nocardioides sp. B-3]|uniref:hypothetical protein n=1 Tax=Nocardioides sp. B-3 TaxID=2895565 RepID=UPI0021539706|nr:hypothetical protein [Nocardioides sp. B-3]UUZ58902.1 hypothetical protein LP418_23035 [Nocardioides sp. B-3]